MDGPHQICTFLQLPKELRLTIYALVLGPRPSIRVGNRAINDAALAEWPLQPDVCRACRLFRAETLDMYYSTVSVQLNIQRPSGEYMVLAWLRRLAGSIPDPFNMLRHVSIIAGLGYCEPPKEYRVDVQHPALISASRPCAAAYLYTRRSNMRSWSRLVSGALKRRLQQMPGSRCPKFSAATNLRHVIALVGELSGYSVAGDWAPWIDANSIRAPSVAAAVVRSDLKDTSRLLTLPKELRLIIYEHVFADGQVMLGWRAVRDPLLTGGLACPGLLTTCSLLWHEALPAYFAHTHFVLNVQRILCEESVLEWVRRCSLRHPEAFQSINHVSVVMGSGIRQPPREFEFHMHDSRLVSNRDRLITQPYTLPEDQWDPPQLNSLKLRLHQLPKKGQAGFDVGRHLRDIISTLCKCPA